MRRLAVIALVVGAAATIFACGGSPNGPSGPAGTLNVRLTDGPYGSAQAVLITFSQVAAHRSESDWEKVPFANNASSWTCDLKKLEDDHTDILGTGPISAAHYTMLRLVVSQAKLFWDTPSSSATPCAASITEPPGAQSLMTISNGEVRLNGEFTLTADTQTTILLDFKGEDSIRAAGSSYMMTPVIGILSVE